MKVTVKELRNVIRDVLTETYDTTPPVQLDDDMPRIVSYGKELGTDDGTGESGDDDDVNEGLGSSKKPTTYLGTCRFDDDDPENSDEDFPTKLTSLKQEIFAPGFQDFGRTMGYDIDDIDDARKMNAETEAWETCVELFDETKANFGFISMADPDFIDFAMSELKKSGFHDGVVTRMKFRLENEQ